MGYSRLIRLRPKEDARMEGLPPTGQRGSKFNWRTFRVESWLSHLSESYLHTFKHFASHIRFTMDTIMAEFIMVTIVLSLFLANIALLAMIDNRHIGARLTTNPYFTVKNPKKVVNMGLASHSATKTEVCIVVILMHFSIASCYFFSTVALLFNSAKARRTL